ncbi:hypothetical protein CR513_10922, partial [Mucuna pruriens]
MIITIEQGATFVSDYSKSFQVNKDITHDALKKIIEKKLQLEDGKRVVVDKEYHPQTVTIESANAL